MKTTLDLEDELLAEATLRAAEARVSLETYVGNVLRNQIQPRPVLRGPFRLDLPVVRGTAEPAVDVDDRRALYDFLDQLS